ncbi:MAG: hypothetical protein Q4P06_08765, partial [Actinomycetaceae bacterium]|nr:hypothetical protein [Actinomycetaceae bacterium]
MSMVSLGRMRLLRLLPVLVAALALLVPFSLQLAHAEEEVVIKDPVLRQAIESQLGDKPATAANVATLESLIVYYDEVASLEGLEHATNLKELSVETMAGSDLTPLSGLTNLTKLGLSGEGYSDLSALSELTNLTDLELVGEGFSDLSPLAGLTNLTVLHLLGDGFSGVPPIERMAKLEDLMVVNSLLTDASAYANISVPSLNLYGSITDFRPFAGKIGEGKPIGKLDGLQSIVIDGGKPEKTNVVTLPELFAPDGTKIQLNAVDASESGANVVVSGDTATITATGEVNKTGKFCIAKVFYKYDVDPYTGMNFEVYVNFSDEAEPAEPTDPAEPGEPGDSVVVKDPGLKTVVEDALGGKPATAANVATLEQLDAGGVEVGSLEGLEYATNLKSLKVAEFGGSDLSALAGLTTLTELWLEGDGFSDLSALSGLTNLTKLTLKGDGVSGVPPVEQMAKLEELSVSNSLLTDVSAYANISVQRLNLDGSITDFRPFAGKVGEGKPIGELSGHQIIVVDGGKPGDTTVVTLPELFAPDGTKIPLTAVGAPAIPSNAARASAIELTALAASESDANVVISGDSATITAPGDVNPGGQFQIAEASYSTDNVKLSFEVFVEFSDETEPTEPT